MLDACIFFYNGATSKIDDVLLEHGGLLHVFTLAVNLNFLWWAISTFTFMIIGSVVIFVSSPFYIVSAVTCGNEMLA